MEYIEEGRMKIVEQYNKKDQEEKENQYYKMAALFSVKDIMEQVHFMELYTTMECWN